MVNDWKNFVKTSLSIRNDKVCIRGTRVMVSIILDCLAEGMSEEDILNEYPSLKKTDVRVALSYAAILARNETLIINNRE